MRTIHHVLDIDAPAWSVWRALTERDGLAGWWSTRLGMDPAAAGASIRFTFDGDFNPVMQITALDEGRELRWRCTGGHQNWQDNTFTFELVPLGDDRTRLRFTQDYAVELSDDDYGVYNFNWGYYLESLRLLCTTGTGKPYEPAG
jgi:uncharacterized protein YndB with AHSA1/START domain